MTHPPAPSRRNADVAPTPPATRPTAFHTNAIGIGEIGVARSEGVLRTFVGSCIGLAIFDQRQRVAGLAHIMLPDSKGDLTQPGRYADTAIPEMMRLLRDTVGGLNLRLAAKMVGGAKMFAFQSGVTVGDQNVAAVERILRGLGIPVLARDCGGERGRRVSFDITNGEMRVETLGLPPAIL